MESVTDLEMDYRVLSTLEDNPAISQRQMARQLDVSLGKVNYCLKALVEAGMVKAGNFQKSSNKSAYSYLLTRKGIRQKSRTTRAFLSRKMMEYDTLEAEIAQLKEYLEENTDD
jgi:MarR family transcriptional regulator, temperature-dependent positive regulator of motility